MDAKISDDELTYGLLLQPEPSANSSNRSMSRKSFMSGNYR